MELRQLRQFYEVCRQGSFSAAGERLYMTQQAVGKSMKQLEDELGVVLFIRIKTGVSLTPQGKYLESRCVTLFDFIKETEDQIQQIGAECPLRTRISLPEAIAHGLESSKDLFTQTPFIDCTVVRNDMTQTCLFEQEADADQCRSGAERGADDLSALKYPVLRGLPGRGGAVLEKGAHTAQLPAADPDLKARMVACAGALNECVSGSECKAQGDPVRRFDRGGHSDGGRRARPVSAARDGLRGFRQ